jgi:hypothetical protein
MSQVSVNVLLSFLQGDFVAIVQAAALLPNICGGTPWPGADAHEGE